jgi:uncharacterized protein YggE
MNATTSSRPSWLLVTAAGGLLVGLLAGPVLASATAPSRIYQVAPGVDGQPAEHTIAVVGSGKVTVVPDMATIQLGVLVEKPSAKAAREAGAQAMTKVVAAIKALGIDDKDITTAMVSLGPIYDYNGTTQKIRAYQLNNTVSVTVRDLDKLSDVLDNSVLAGATTVNGVTFDVADRTGAESKAREAAMADAKAKATTLAGAAGVSITGVSSISESVSTPIWYAPEMSSRAGAVAADAATPVLPGSTDVTITVNVTYLID